MSGFLLDTHVWLWYLSGNDALSKTARQRIESSKEECWLSPISVWEVGLLQEKGRIRFHPELRKGLDKARRNLPLRMAPVTEEVALATFDLDLPHRDPADRFIAATSRVFDLTLLTADRRLLDAPSLETFSARD